MNDQKQKIFTLDESTLSRYISNKIYYAKPMKRGEYCENRGWDVPENENPDDDGYIILYPDGYISWNLKSNFEETSSRTDGMNFGMALAALRMGKAVRLPQWSDDVKIKCAHPTPTSIMTAAYLYVESRHGTVPWKETMIELFSEEWQITD